LAKSRRDVENLMRVRELLYARGFTIAGAKKQLREKEPLASDDRERVGEPGKARMREELETLKSEVEAFLRELS
jgi:DNA-binding transcriptional MerR regulator